MTRPPQSAQHPSAAKIGAVLLASCAVLFAGCETEQPPLAPTDVADDTDDDAPVDIDAEPSDEAAGKVDAEPAGEIAAAPDADITEAGTPSRELEPASEKAPAVTSHRPEPALVRQPTPAPQPAAKPAPQPKPAPEVDTTPPVTKIALAPQPSRPSPVPRPSPPAPRPATPKTKLSKTPTKKPMSQLTPAEKKKVVVYQRVTKQVEVLDGLSTAKTELRDSIGYLKQAIRILRSPAREEAEATLDEIRAALVEFEEIHRELRAEVNVALDESERDLPPGY